VKYKPGDGKWYVRPHTKRTLEPIRAALGEEGYAETRRAFQEALCVYFSTGTCLTKHGKFISPIAGDVCDGGKCFKVRWMVPGRGKRGGLRLAVIAYCEERTVVLAGAWVRKEDPTDEEIDGAIRKAGR
jgi:hypothetical protein